jgi:predicted HTH transcriptional regulator
MSQRIFISSVQREFAKERKALAEYVRKDAILGRFFDVFLFEEVPAQERKADGVYLAEVDACDIYLGIFGHTYGNVDSSGVSATEREYQRAAKKRKTRICFVDKSAGDTDPRQAAFLSQVNEDVIRKGFVGYDDLRTAVYAALAKCLEDKGFINVLPFDASKTAGVTMKDLSVAKMRDFIRTAREKRQFPLPVNVPIEQLLMALELLDDDGRLLNPAALLFGKRPQKFFITSEVKCAQFYADRVSKPMADHQIYTGDVFELVDQATRFVMTHISNWVGTRETGDTAEVPTKFELPYDAVKEAIVNAVVHRDYTSNASVQVMLFKDRLEEWSPGGLPRGMTIGKLFAAHKSVPVNPLLARAMYLKGYIEKSGTGTGDMIAKCASWGVPAPEWYEDDPDDFRVVLKRPVSVTNMVKTRVETRVKTGVKSSVKSSVESSVKSRVKSSVKKLSSAEKIVAYLRTTPTASAHELSIVVNLTVRAVEKNLRALRESNRLRRVGPDKGGHWEVIG